MIKELKEAKQERDRLLPIMTAYERQTVSEYITETRERYRPTITGGALAVWEGAKANLKAALKNVETQKRKVTNSWDAPKLAAEMQVYSMRIDQATKADAGSPDLPALEGIYQEAKDSGDRYKERAAAETLQSLVSKIPTGLQDSHGTDMRQAANRIAREAGRDLEALQTSPELTAAHELAAAKVQELNAAKSLLFDTAETMGDTVFNGDIRNSHFEKAIATVQQDEEGNFIFKE